MKVRGGGSNMFVMLQPLEKTWRRLEADTLGAECISAVKLG